MRCCRTQPSFDAFCVLCVTKFMFVFPFLASVVRIVSLGSWNEYKEPNSRNWSTAHFIPQWMCLTMHCVNTTGLINLCCRPSFPCVWSDHFKWLRRPLSPSNQQKGDDSRSECNFLLWAAAAKSQFVFSFCCFFYIWAAAQTHTPGAHKASLKKKGEGNMHFSCSAGFAWINTTTRFNFLSTWPEGSAAHTVSWLGPLLPVPVLPQL